MKSKTHHTVNSKEKYFEFSLKKACTGCKHNKPRVDSDTGVDCTLGLVKACRPFTERNYYTS